jgi:ADP-ribose pyrophosphatase YjhB (NUDIX family)
MAADGEQLPFSSRGQDWLGTWHPPTWPIPPGKNHGANAVCLTRDGQVVLVSNGGAAWGLPGGRPEADESWRQTLERELLEEACARVVDAKLLGCARGVCVRGHEAGLVLVRSAWLALVEVDEWAPRYEMTHRRLLSPSDALSELARYDQGTHPAFLQRFFHEALLVHETMQASLF